MIQQQLEKRYIEETLTKSGSKLETAYKTSINRQDFKTKTTILSTIRHQISENKLTFDIAAHQRFQDLKTISSQPNHKKHPIYNRYVYGYYGYIAQQLMFGFTEDVRQRLLKDLNSPS